MDFTYVYVLVLFYLTITYKSDNIYLTNNLCLCIISLQGTTASMAMVTLTLHMCSDSRHLQTVDYTHRFRERSVASPRAAMPFY